MYFVNPQVVKNWEPLLDHKGQNPIKNKLVRSAVAQMMENTRLEVPSQDSYSILSEGAPTNSMGTSSSTHGAGNIDTFDPIMISMLRRNMPNLVAYDICGVQPMKGPTGLIFAIRMRYDNQTGTEAWYLEANTGQSARGGANVSANSVTGYGAATNVGGGANNVGANSTFSIPGSSNNAGNSTYNYSGGLNTFTVEGLGSNTTAIFPEMSMSIEKVTATANSRALKAEYSMELAQDLRAIHNLDAETELSNLLSTEILAEINREIVRAINITAVQGSQTDVTTAGTFDLDVDSNGRWLAEKFTGMYYQIERESNVIAKQTRRGKGNILLCTADIASALNAASTLSYRPGGSPDLQVDDTGNTFVGTLPSGMKVYIDPYAIGGNYWTAGYKGANPMDAGIFYCPYVPLQMVRAVDPSTMQPKIGFKTRYSVVANPYAEGLTQGLGVLHQDSNVYYRRTIVVHLQ